MQKDIEKAKEINRGIRKGSLRSFSIGGQALEKVKKTHDELGEYNEISKLNYGSITDVSNQWVCFNLKGERINV